MLRSKSHLAMFTCESFTCPLTSHEDRTFEALKSESFKQLAFSVAGCSMVDQFVDTRWKNNAHAGDIKKNFEIYFRQVSSLVVFTFFDFRLMIKGNNCNT